MKINVYDIILDPKPKLHIIGKINCEKPDFCNEKLNAEMLNDELLLNKLSSEHIYAVGMMSNYSPTGILLLGIGDGDSVIVDIRKLGTGLLLMGSDGFRCYHNHPNGDATPSKNDIENTDAMRRLSEIIEVDFLGHYAIGGDQVIECDCDTNCEEDVDNMTQLINSLIKTNIKEK